ncbi:MAG TPA: nitroreductase family protein [Anaerolineales bacterium]|nr:nitroreductase family protein [Anaerolineales bacterium]
MDVHEAIRTQRAVRQFADTPIPDEVVLQIVNAGRRAQSAKNMQPWHFIALRDKNRLKKLSECGTYAQHLAGAALGIAIITVHPDTRWSIMFDAGQAAAYMQLEAWELGVGSCMATIYEPDKARELLGFPEDLHLRAAISFGYPAEESKLTEPPKRGGRNTLGEVLHWERWKGERGSGG